MQKYYYIIMKAIIKMMTLSLESAPACPAII